MNIKECLLNQFKRGFFGTNLPDNNLLVSLISEHLCANSEVIERTDNIVRIKFIFDDGDVVLKCVLREGKTLKQIVSEIILE